MGTNYLAGTSNEAILSAVNQILSGNPKKGTIPYLWDGNASGRIADILLRYAISYMEVARSFGN
jgi:UDP-N-acetylglucosamine 2-epimerase (non-hydrolysing)